MKRSPEKAPSGQWSMPDLKLLQMLGAFVMSWSLIEAAMEVSIGKLLGTKPLETSIVTAGLMFRARFSILMSLLNRDPDKYADAIAILKEIDGIHDRNDIMHSVIGGSADMIWFNRRQTKQAFTSKIEKYRQVRINTLALHTADLSGRLMAAMGITREDYLAFFQQSHNAVNKAE